MSERRALLAQVAMGSRDWEAASRHAEAAVAGGYTPALGLVAAIAYRRRDYAKAISLLEAEGEGGFAPDFQGAAAQALLIRLHLLAGEPLRGWQLLKEGCRSKAFGPSLYDLPRWSGEPLEGRRIVAWGRGYGDDIFFARFLPRLARAGARVVVNCRPALTRLMRGIEGVAEVLPLDAEVRDADFHVQLAELPAILEPRNGEAWPGAPYLKAEPVPLPGRGKRVGLLWAADARHWDTEDRTATLADMAPLGRVPGVSLFSLQFGPQGRQAAPAPAGMALEELGSRLPDFADTAAVIAALDLLITVDTAAANLAGALGARVWVAVPFIPDWRWGTQGDHTPWYPTAKVYRQPRPGDWRSVFAAMAQDLGTALD
jgi:hypothetical protein